MAIDFIQSVEPGETLKWMNTTEFHSYRVQFIDSRIWIFRCIGYRFLLSTFLSYSWAIIELFGHFECLITPTMEERNTKINASSTMPLFFITDKRNLFKYPAISRETNDSIFNLIRFFIWISRAAHLKFHSTISIECLVHGLEMGHKLS